MRSEFFRKLEEVLDEQFPKKKCKERGAALVLFSYANIFHDEMVKQAETFNFEKGHDQWLFKSDSLFNKGECPRCHREKPLGTCEDGCKMCQSCYHKIHGMGALPSDTMNI